MIDPTHLLPLSAVADTLPVLFGRDGDFEGAPMWRPMLHGAVKEDDGYWPLWRMAARGPTALYRDANGYAEPIMGATLDLRIPSVAARVAGLCARAIDPRATSAHVDAHPDGWTLHWTLPNGHATAALWDHDGCAWHTDAPSVERYLPDYKDTTATVFLAALFLALAPRIAALGGSHVR